MSTTDDPTSEPTWLVAELERGILAIEGPDRSSWLNGVVTCDVNHARPGQAGFGLLLSKQGKIQTDFWLVASNEALFLAVAPGTAPATKLALDRMLVMEDAELEDRSEALVCLWLVGPAAGELLQAAGAPVTAAWGAVRRAGGVGAVALVAREAAGDAERALEALGARRAEGDAWQRLRVERGIGAFGVDYGPDDNPHEASLDRAAVDWAKGCYLGQEVVFMQDARGRVKRRVVRLDVQGGVPRPGAVLALPGGDVVGEVTSVASTATGARLLGRVRAPSFEPGTRLVAAGFPAEVREGPR